jgi:hypothetical protein
VVRLAQGKPVNDLIFRSDQAESLKEVHETAANITLILVMFNSFNR